MSNSNALRGCGGCVWVSRKPEQVESIWPLLVEREIESLLQNRIWEERSSAALASYYKELYCHYPAAVECTWRRTIRETSLVKPFWLHAG